MYNHIPKIFLDKLDFKLLKLILPSLQDVLIVTKCSSIIEFNENFSALVKKKYDHTKSYIFSLLFIFEKL